MDILSGIILELAGIAGGAKGNEAPPIVHTVNPIAAEWESALLPTVCERLTRKAGTGSVEVIELQEWVQLLSQAAAEADGPGPAAEQLSAFKLVSFVNSLVQSSARPVFSTATALTISPTLKKLGPVSEEWMTLWMNQWGFP